MNPIANEVALPIQAGRLMSAVLRIAVAVLAALAFSVAYLIVLALETRRDLQSGPRGASARRDPLSQPSQREA